jgi:CheY-like chemotaxis protein
VSLRILFADDSMTAQNMGKKILSEAGYDVVAVSNGAAAVKKIAEQKPDIIILDVYMPGYSGLEVCEKVRGSLDTLKTPVLLTVGKMEPYKPEDANRVKADGVIIKPFEASDLLAIVKKFEERLSHASVPPIVEQTVSLERKYQEEAPAAPELQIEHHSGGKTSVQPMVEVPDHMAGSAAFTDLLGTDAPITPQQFVVSTPAAAFETSVIVPTPPVPSTDYELVVSWKEEERAEPIAAVAEPEPDLVETPALEVSEPSAQAPMAAVSAMPAEASQPEPPHPQFIPVFQEPEPPEYEMMPTAAPPTEEIEILREPGLQETADLATRSTVADRMEPGLMSTIETPIGPSSVPKVEPATAFSTNMASVASANEAAPTEAIEIVPEEPESPPAPAIETTSEVSDSDFEARVAAAMAAYNHSSEVTPMPAAFPDNTTTVLTESAPINNVYAAHAVAVPAAVAAPAAVTEPAPSFEYQPSVTGSAVVPAAYTAAGLAEVAAPVPPAPEPEPATPEAAATHDLITSGVEAAAVAAVAESGAEHHNIAQAVHRVMERLKPELVEEIMRELRSKK